MAESLLKTEALTCRFGGLTAVDKVDLTVPTNGVYGLIGPNGAGKTTLFNAVTGAVPVSSGRVLWEGRDITGQPFHRMIHLGIARTFQSPQIARSLSVLDNALLGASPHSRINSLRWAFRPERSLTGPRAQLAEEVAQVLAFVGLAGREREIAGGLSYGYQKLLDIARALMGRPRLLLVDEPAAGLNPREKEQLVTILQSLANRGMTVVLVEHDMKMVMGVCQRIAVLEYGRCIAEGTPAEVQSNAAVILAYLGTGTGDARATERGVV